LGLKLRNKPPKRSGESQAAGRPLRGDAAERDQGDGPCARPVGDGRKIRIRTLADTFSRFSPLIDRRFTCRSENVVEAQDRACGCLGYPKAIRVPNRRSARSSQFVSKP
jgi:putative transposase